jgi:predicted TIM-barrel fold metal-dependent hydrolase
MDYRAFDGDNHYYEALDAFTRHLDPRLGPRVIEWATINGRSYHVIGGRVSRAVTNPTFDPVSPAGALSHYFRGNPEGKSPLEYLREREPIRPEYRDRDRRLEVMDAQGLDRIWLFPTLGMIYEELLKQDPEATAMMFRAFNRWLEEDWGFHHAERIFAAPYITLADVDAAVTELEFALDHGARVVCLRPAAPTTRDGRRRPGDPLFDRFWGRASEAGITVVVHAGDSGYTSNGYAQDGFAATFDNAGTPSIKLLSMERAIYDFLASLIFDRLFDRFPNLRIASVENGSEFLGDLFKKLRSVGRKMPGFFREDPVDTFRRHVWINPFWEDDVHETVSLMGADRVVFGSDWPHIEGMPSPLDYAVELKELDADTCRRILLDNVSELNELRPA